MERRYDRTLILITAALNWDRLINLAISINEFKNELSDTNLLWVICFDVANGKGDMFKIYDYCHLKNINVAGYQEGKPHQKNYGGDLFNEPLVDIANRFELDLTKTWVYILDDDNLVHPNLFFTFRYALFNCPDAKIIWMPYMIETGVIPNVRRDNAMTVNRKNTLYNNFPDPSCIIVRFDKLKEVGFYDDGFDYDLKFGRKAIEGHFDEVAFPDDYGMYYHFPVSAYHNGQQGLINMFDDYYLLKDNKLEDITLRTQGWLKKPHVYPIPQELAPKILDMIKKYYRDKGYKF